MNTSLRRLGKRGLLFYRVITSQIRVMPNFIIIGGQRCGTTSFYRNLVKHRNVVPCFVKEVHYFDIDFSKGLPWYRAHFPTCVHRYYKEKIRGKKFVTGEASPYYIRHPRAPRRVFETIPGVKLIALLRNPVDRAYSHYQARFKHGIETLSFEEAIEKEEERIVDELRKMEEIEYYYSLNHRTFSYLSRGIYVDQIEKWLEFFSRERMLIIKSEDFLTKPQEVFDRVADFLDIPRWENEEFRRYNVGHYSEMDPEMRKRLLEYYEPHNQRLYKLLGVDFDWN